MSDPKMTKAELDVFYAKRRKKNWVFLVILGGLSVLFFAITILKMS
ncbi:hypothetical protein [Thalassospira alkalitolerans]|nr:hypothetical protein [Thalassospira alkalitolerans]|tara:strand:+ start:35722 stop:35859 length:138 start_codon:yes stop_codon:yes gene_type:complete